MGHSLLFLVAILAVVLAAAHPPAREIKTFADAYRLVSGHRVSKDDAEAFAAWFGKDALEKGTDPHSEDLRFIFAVSAPTHEAEVFATSDDGSWSVRLKQLGGTDVFAAAATLPEMAAFRWSYRIGAERKGGGELEAYTYPPETKPQPGVPRGSVEEQTPWRSEVFPGTTRQWWIYVPQEYNPHKSACLFVVQDGQWDRNSWTVVLDNMIATRQIPVSIAVFLTPGTIHKELDNRSVEYDTVSDRYVTMIADEILPEVSRRYNIRQDAKGHVIAGVSSGGICAFNAAWFRPELFHKVISWVGSFTNLQGGPTGVAGGNTYPAIIRHLAGWDRKGEPKPMRVFLQDGSNDLDNAAGNWPLANQEMASALAFGGYDYRFELGHGFHSTKHGRALLPEALRWLFRDEKKG
jgi:enterochelin esterase family protein